GSRRSISDSTASTSSGSVVTSTAGESGPCSAWHKRSTATNVGSEVRSARTRTSDGPAGRSMAQDPNTSSLAAVTQAFPGPTIFSTGSSDSVPYARAAIAWAPPMAHTSVAPARRHAASITSGTVPSGASGEATTISSTPATRAGTTVMTTVDG